MNLYSYVRNVPTSKADPDGHCPYCGLLVEIAKGIAEDGGVKPYVNNLATGFAKGAGQVGVGVAVGLAEKAVPGSTAQIAMSKTGQKAIGAVTPSNATQAQGAVLGNMATSATVTAGVAAGVGSGPAAAGGLADDALVVRGGLNQAENFVKGTGVTVDAAGNLQGVSVNSANGATVGELSQGIRNGQVGVSTVGDVRAAGGDVTPSPTANNPNHCTMCGVTPQKAQELFTPTIPNPSKPQ